MRLINIISGKNALCIGHFLLNAISSCKATTTARESLFQQIQPGN